MDSGIYIGLTKMFIKIWRTPANIRINLVSLETRVHAEHFAANSMGLSLLVFTKLFSKSTQKILHVPAQNRT